MFGFVGTGFKVAVILEVEFPEPDIFALLHFLNVFGDFEELFLEFVVAIINDILDVIFDYKGLSFENFIEHYFKSIKLFGRAAVLIEYAFADLGY